MRDDAYVEMDKVEEKHWWFVARRKIVYSLMKKYVGSTKSLIDIGCGTGFNFNFLSSFTPNIFGLEVHKKTFELVSNRYPKIKIFNNLSDVESSKLTFDAVTMFDVLEHIEDDKGTLSSAYSMLNKNGYLVLTVPAFMFLWSGHDERVFHKRRYTRDDLSEKLKNAGFDICKISYYNFFLFLPILFVRVLGQLLGRRETSDFDKTPIVLNSVFRFVMSFEKYILKYLNFPFGVSIICIAKKR